MHAIDGIRVTRHLWDAARRLVRSPNAARMDS